MLCIRARDFAVGNRTAVWLQHCRRFGAVAEERPEIGGGMNFLGKRYRVY